VEGTEEALRKVPLPGVEVVKKDIPRHRGGAKPLLWAQTLDLALSVPAVSYGLGCGLLLCYSVSNLEEEIHLRAFASENFPGSPSHHLAAQGVSRWDPLSIISRERQELAQGPNISPWPKQSQSGLRGFFDPSFGQ
jgi:hypothetical protein